ncbi:MAG: sugar transferase [Solobacterium sp.]|jgi:lipopolysaccharide/colanic/teichoic acid biosynthesis glycosyltransferase|nr:sugar transferase [Solobacterium sp.]
MLEKWEKIPEWIRQPEVREYYDILAKKKGSLFLKRIFDILLALILFIILLIPMIIIAIYIKTDSSGPVFYRQRRVTTYGREFRIHKFRTMVTNAEQIGTAVTVGEDPRITKAGHFLRKTRLDELPQLIDVLEGTMTFVGTRPEAVKYVEHYTPAMRATLLLPAGITSEASILYKDEAELLENAEDADRTYIEEILPAKMEYNLQSIRNFSLLNDLRTMFATVGAVLK